MAWGSGSNFGLLGYKETTYGVQPGAIVAERLPCKSFDPGIDRNQIVSEVLNSNVNAMKPSAGNTVIKPKAVIPIDVNYFGYWLQAALGPPNTTQNTAKALNNGAAAVNVGDGVVGLPCTAHGFKEGETITIANTTNYNGDEVVLASSTANQVNITASYIAENMGATSTARVKRYTHVFTAATSLYSYLLEQGFSDINQYFTLLGCMVDQLGLKFGGDAELLANIDMIAASASRDVTSVDTPDTQVYEPFSNFHCTLFKEGGASVATAKDFDFSLKNNIDTSAYCLNGRGFLTNAVAGKRHISGSLGAMFEDGTLYDKASAETPSSLEMTLAIASNKSLTFKIDELIYKLSGIPVTTPNGIWQTLNFEGYYESGASASILKVTMINNVATYVWS